MASRSSRSGGFFFALFTLFGAMAGVLLGHPRDGAIAGAILGVVALIVIWLLDR
jgi:hypothetical protein